jgi:hypothetical protein
MYLENWILMLMLSLSKAARKGNGFACDKEFVVFVLAVCVLVLKPTRP